MKGGGRDWTLKGIFSRCPETAAKAQIWTKMSIAAHTLRLKNCQWLETAVFQQGIEEP